MKIKISKFSWSAISRMLQQLIVVGTAITALSACGPGLASLGPFTIGGTVTGLTGTVVLQNNGKDDLNLTANGSFTFVTKSAKDATYLVTVLNQPSGQICTVSGGGGAATDNVTAVSVDCVTQWTGTKQLGGVGTGTSGQSVAVDTNGNVYVVGETMDSLDGNSLLGTSDLFLTKYNTGGIKQFTQQFGVVGAATTGRSVAIDSSGNVYVAGYTSGQLGLDAQMGVEDAFVIKYNSKGERQYIKQLGVVGQVTQGLSVAVDANLNVYVAGVTTGGLDGGAPVGDTDSFVAKYDSNGVRDLLFTKQWGVAGANTSASSVATDAGGNVYVAGYTTDGLDGNSKVGTSDLFITRFDSGGAKQYTQQLGVAGVGTYGNSVVVDAAGSVYLTGETSGMLYRDALTGSSDLFVAKFNGSLAILYLHQLGVAAQPTGGQSIALDTIGNAYVAGYTQGGLDGNVLAAGPSYSFVTKYDSNGVKK